MAIYRQAVVTYVRGNLGFSGTVGDGALVFPAGYVRNPLWTNTVSAGMIAVYPSGTVPVDILADIVRIAEGSMFAGRSMGGVIVSPVRGNTGIPLPTGTPNGVTVWGAKVS